MIEQMDIDKEFEIDGKAIYPSAFPRPYSGKIQDAVIQQLQKKSKVRHKLRGATTTNPELIACFSAPTEKVFREANSTDDLVVMSWIWPTPFGRVTSFSLFLKNKPVSQIKIFVPADEKFGRSVYETGMMVFFISFRGKRTKLYEADFSLGKMGGARALEITYKSSVDPESELLEDFDSAFWSCLSIRDNWLNLLSDDDQVSISWSKHYHEHLIKILRGLTETQDSNVTQLIDAREIKNTEDVSEAEKRYPKPLAIFREIATSKPKLQNIFQLFFASIANPKDLEELLVFRFHYGNRIRGLPSEIFVLFDELFLAFQMNSQSTKCGTRRLWLKDSKEGVEVAYIELNKSFIGSNYPHYWRLNGIEATKYPFNLGYFLGTDEGPAHPVNCSWFSELVLDCSQQEAIDCYESLIRDASENAQWTIPWGARLQLNLKEINYVDLYQFDDEVCFVFRSGNEYMHGALNISSGNIVLPSLIGYNSLDLDDAGNWPEVTDVELALAILLASAIRDFIVVEERNAVFSTRRRKNARSLNKKLDDELRIIYLPRVKYLKAAPTAYLEADAPALSRQAHEVKHHFRKSGGSSRAQQWLARSYGLDIPKGYTFVKPHSRGGIDRETKVIYRSRSASKLIYAEVVRGTSEAKWFKFERDVANYLKALGWEVQHKSINRNGDGGVDVYAYNRITDECWAIQCKCWSPRYRVEPEVVRALFGSLDNYPEETKGMIITTSDFTSGAREEAEKKGISLISGAEFASLAMEGFEKSK